MTPIPIEKRRANAAKYGGEVEKKYGLTGPQMGILRAAARKWAGAAKPVCGSPQLHDGQVNTYNVRGDTLAALEERGFIANVHLYSEEQRQARWKQAEEIKKEMFRLAGYYKPNDRIPAVPENPKAGTMEVWKLVLKELQQAETLLKGNEQKVIRITDAGRAVAAEFKEAIGAEEE